MTGLGKLKLANNKLILVTGGCGYIGSMLVEKLVELGHSVRVVDKQYWGTSGIDLLPRVEIINADVRNVDPRWFKNVDSVVHLASLSNDPTAEFDEGATYSINYVATKNLVEAAKTMGVRAFTYASSAAVYGFHISRYANEENEVHPQSKYAETKLLAEECVLEKSDGAFRGVVLRQGTLYGYSRRMRWDLVINTFIMQALTNGIIYVHGTGDAWRPFIHVSDVVNAHINSIFTSNESISGEIFNLVTENYTIKELARIVQKELNLHGITTEIRFSGENDKRNYKIDGSKFEKAVGYGRIKNVKDGVSEIVKKYSEGYISSDFGHPKFYNLKWLECLSEMENYFMNYKKAL